MRVDITGDVHRIFSRIEQYCAEQKTTKDDVLIILGDAGINYRGEVRDAVLKRELSELPVTLFCVHGNHEARPESVWGYHQKQWNGGMVYVQDEYPNLLFAKDGEIYNINGLRTVALGGAYSIDKFYRIIKDMPWFEDEQPSYEIKKFVEKQLQKENWSVDVVLSHTVPKKYEPVEAFIEGLDQSRIDKSTEIWLQEIEDKLQYKVWLAGHYHIQKIVETAKGKLEIMYENVHSFPMETR